MAPDNYQKRSTKNVLKTKSTMSLNEDLGHITIDQIINKNNRSLKKSSLRFNKSPSDTSDDRTLSSVMKLNNRGKLDKNPFILISSNSTIQKKEINNDNMTQTEEILLRNPSRFGFKIKSTKSLLSP